MVDDNVVSEDICTRIVRWNEMRGLLDEGFNHENEVTHIIEELYESTGKYTSKTARKPARSIAERILSVIDKFGVDKKVIVDSFADIIVFAIGAIRKLGYDPAKVMDETCKEIESRTGTLIEGKFVKDEDVVRYVANYEVCKITD